MERLQSRAARRLFRIGFTVIAVFVATYTLSTLTSFSEVANIMTSVALLPSIVAVGCYYLTVPTRTARWQDILGNLDIPSETGFANRLMFLSLYFNTIFPAKAGDVHRSLVAEREFGGTNATLLGTVTVERFLDVFVLGAGVAVSALVLLPQGMAEQRYLILLAAGTVSILTMGLLLGAYFPVTWLPDVVVDYVREFRAGMATVAIRENLPTILGLTITIWGLNVVRAWFVALALSVPLSPGEVVLVSLVLAFLTGLPYTPAGVGFVEVGGTLAITALGYSSSLAVSFVLLDRLITVGSVVLTGTAYYIYLKISNQTRLALHHL